LIGSLLLWISPISGLDIRVGALVGMAAMFAGASRALLTSVVFAFETTLQPNGLLPVLLGSTLAFLVARLLMQNSIMTEKIARRGLRIPQDYDPDAFQHTAVGEIMNTDLKTLPPDGKLSELAGRIARHDPSISVYQAWPLVDSSGSLSGIITRNDLHRALEKPGATDLTLLEAGSSALVVAYPDETVHDAVARMLAHGVGRLPVVSRAHPNKLIGYIGRANLLSIRLKTHHQETRREAGWLSMKRRVQS
jgi:CBS domain-containing protein